MPESKVSGGKGYDEMVGKLSPKDRQNMEKQLTSYDEAGDKGRATLWKRLVGTMSDLAPGVPPKTSAQRTVQFFVPDGKWRMQVFAIEDRKDGVIAVYIEDVLSEAIKAGVISKAKTKTGVPGEYVAKGTETPIVIEQLDGKTEMDPAPFYKDMLGWNRKALRVTVGGDAPEGHARVIEKLCELAAVRRKPKGEKAEK
jgi:hypothetical protein